MRGSVHESLLVQYDATAPLPHREVVVHKHELRDERRIGQLTFAQSRAGAGGGRGGAQSDRHHDQDVRGDDGEHRG